ncbi:MAG: hypothetical protein JW717_01770 [Marinilabiliaceae bacterium]|nr:hypothetical protein [Marinilabiliaceae bacterium]
MKSNARRRYYESLDYGVKTPDGKIIFPNGRKEKFNDGWRWKWGKDKLEWGIKNGFIEVQESTSKECGWGVYYKIYLNVDNEGKKIKRSSPYKNIIQGILNTHASSEAKELFGKTGVFSNPKPANLIKKLLIVGTKSNDLILDFFSGSGTTAHAVMDLNKEDGGSRKCICIQLPELCEEKSEAFKLGYKTISDVAKDRIRKASKKIANEIKAENEKKKGKLDFEQGDEEKQIDLGFKVLKLSDSNFKQWQQIEGKDAKALEEQMKLFVDPVSEKATIENMVYELLLKSGKDINSYIKHKNEYFCINTNEMVLMLEKATQEIVTAVLNEKPQKVIALDRLFKGNDQLKTNTALQMKDAGIEFKTI